MPYDAGLTYDSAGSDLAGGGGSKFGGKWVSGGLAGLSGAGTASPGYSRGPRRSLQFTASSTPGVFDATYFNLQKLTYVSGGSSSSSSSGGVVAAPYQLLEPSGMIRAFDGSGRIASVSGKCGNYTSYQYHSGSGRIEEVSTTFDNGTNRYVYGWTGDKITSVTYYVDSRAILKAVYAYTGDQLTTVKLFENTTSSNNPSDWGSPISCSLYTYHTESGLLRHVIPPTQYRQMVNNGITIPELADESVLNSYASAEYEYESGRVSRMYKHGRRYTHDFEYAFNYPSGSNLNQWTTRTTVTLSEGPKHVYYFNRIGQWMLHRVIEDPTVATKVWNPLYQEFDATKGRLVRTANDSAIKSVDDTTDELVELEGNQGLISESAYNSAGRLESTGIRKGTNGTPITQRMWTYEARTVGTKGTIYVPSSQTVYRTENLASAITTTFSYLWYEDSFQYSKRTTTLPVIDASQNGRGQTLTTESHFNSRGLLVKSVDQRGTVTDYTYDEARGGMTSQTEDVGTGRMNLVSDYQIDDRGRTVRTLGPVHTVDIDGTATAIRSARWTYYLDAADSRWSFSGYQTATGTPTNHLVGPVIIERSNTAPPPTPGSDYSGWRQSATIAAAYEGTGIPAPTDTFPQDTWLRWSIALFDKSSELKEQRTYFDIPTDDGDYGSRSLNYARTLYAYDALGRQNKTTDPDDTVDQTTYNAMDWATKAETGTVADLLLTTALNEYDDDGNLLKITLPVSGSDRITEFLYDWRNRRTHQSTVVEKDGGGTWTLITQYAYDNLNHTIEVTGYHTAVVGGNRTSHQSTAFDDLGRTYRITVRGVDPANGNLTGSLVSNLYYNETGQVARSAPAGSQLFTTTIYDRLGRTRLVSQAYELSTSSSSSSSSAGPLGPDPADLANAIVMSQQEMFWDDAGNLISSTTRERFDTATGSGDLGNPTTEPKARVSYAAAYPDPIGRTVATADYGTAGFGTGGRPTTVPSRSDTVLVTTSTFDIIGDLTHQTDPASITIHRTFDDAGRLTILVENSTGLTDERRTTRYEYTDASGLKKLISQNPDTDPETEEQVTEWLRGVTTGQGSAINSNRLVFQKIYPGSGPTTVTYTYNRQSQPNTFTDQAGTKHTYSYDKLGRLLVDRVSFPKSSTLDRAVGALTTGYNERGLVVRSTSRVNVLGSIVNEVKSAYNDFNQLITEWQEHSGAVNTSTSQKVQYAYENGAANTIRPTTITSPGATAITTAYESAQANALSRPDQVKQGTTVLASMKFLGLGTLVEVDYEAASHARFTLKNGSTGDAGDIYTGLDRFGRLIETLWKTTSTTLIQTTYGRNRVGGVVWQYNVKAHASSIATQDHYYWYDGLQQVTQHERGDLVPGPSPNFTGIDAATRQQQEIFTFDETGNWKSEEIQNPALYQTRSHNPANQITGISGPTGAIQPAYDPAGNMTLMPRTSDWTAGDELTWDAWNRLTRIRPASSSSSSSSSSFSSSSSSEPHASSGSYHSASSSSSAPAGEVTYQYDARTRRTRKTNAAGTIDYYYDNQWRAIEEHISGTVTTHYVWSPLDRWTMIRRKRGSEQLYVLKDYLDPSAIINPSGTVIERFGYDAFGPVRFMDAAFAPRTTSAADWNFLYHAEFLDKDTGLYNYGYRYYNPQLGRWLSKDPIGMRGGLNLYRYLKNSPLRRIDFLGLQFDDDEYPSHLDREGYRRLLESQGRTEGKSEEQINDIIDLLMQIDQVESDIIISPPEEIDEKLPSDLIKKLLEEQSHQQKLAQRKDFTGTFTCHKIRGRDGSAQEGLIGPYGDDTRCCLNAHCDYECWLNEDTLVNRRSELIQFRFKICGEDKKKVYGIGFAGNHLDHFCPSPIQLTLSFYRNGTYSTPDVPFGEPPSSVFGS